MSDTTAAMNTKTDERAVNSSDPVSISCSEPETPTLCLSGGSTSTTPIRRKKASIARSSGTKRRTATSRPSLSDRLTPSLISAGLVKGTTPKSIRKQLGARIRDTVFWLLDGGDLDGQKTENSSLNDREPLGE
jgi:hypothetical protein